MAELIQDKLYQVSIGSRWNFSFIHAKDEEDLIRYLAKNIPNKDEVYGAREILTDGTSRTAKIISHPLFQELYAQNETMGVTRPLPNGVCIIDRRPWAVMLPTGGFTPDSPCQWNDLLTVTGTDNSRTHHMDMASWCLEASSPEHPTEHVRRGIMSADKWDALGFNHLQEPNGGFRPALIPLDSETFKPRPSLLLGREDGDRFCMGTLYMDNEPLVNPLDPTINGDIPDYKSGSDLKIGNSSSDAKNRITWIKVGNALIADRNILKNISWNDLDRLGLARGPTSLNLARSNLGDTLKNAQDRVAAAKNTSTRELLYSR